MSAELSTIRDPTDREILGVLATRGRISWSELGRIVHLSPNAAAERVRRLEARGVIVGYAALVDHSALGRPFEAMVDVIAHPGIDRSALEESLREEPAVVDAVHLTGSHDYLLHIRCRDATELDELLMRMKADGGVAQTTTRVVLRHL